MWHLLSRRRRWIGVGSGRTLTGPRAPESSDSRRSDRATRLFDAKPAFGVVRTAGFFAIFDAVTRRTRVLLFLVAAAVLAPSALVAYGMPNGTSRPAPGI